MRMEAVMQANKNEKIATAGQHSAIASRICSRWTYPCNKGAPACVSIFVSSSRFRSLRKNASFSAIL